MENAVVLKGVTKAFGDKRAVDALDLAIPQGSLCGFIGPNGAGKTTSIRMIMSIIFPDQGEITVLDHASALEAKDRIGYLPEERGLYRKMKVGAFLRYLGRLKGAATARLRSQIPNWLARLDLEGVEGKRCEDLSKGMQQKVQLVAALLNEPELLILDEPFTGLDPVSTRALRALLAEEQQRGTTILFSTHMMAEAELLCDRVVMIHQGRKVLDQSIAGIRAQFDPRSVLFEPLNPSADMTRLEALASISRIERQNDGYELRLEEGADLAAALRDIAATVAPAKLQVQRPSLEDIFVQIVTAGGEESAEELEIRVQAATEKKGRP
jgi:ABC-2 type transport system ATP-binding protein